MSILERTDAPFSVGQREIEGGIRIRRYDCRRVSSTSSSHLLDGRGRTFAGGMDNEEPRRLRLATARSRWHGRDLLSYRCPPLRRIVVEASSKEEEGRENDRREEVRDEDGGDDERNDDGDAGMEDSLRSSST
jgi:hypothetical protein